MGTFVWLGDSFCFLWRDTLPSMYNILILYVWLEREIGDCVWNWLSYICGSCFDDCILISGLRTKFSSILVKLFSSDLFVQLCTELWFYIWDCSFTLSWNFSIEIFLLVRCSWNFETKIAYFLFTAEYFLYFWFEKIVLCVCGKEDLNLINKFVVT